MRGTIDLRTDEELVDDAGSGSRTAFEELYRRHADAAWGVAMSVTRDRNDAADAVSDAFIRLFKAVEDGRLHGVPFRPYLLTSTRNAAIDILRRSSRLDPTGDIDAELHGSPAIVGADAPSDAVVAGAEHALVARAFADLPERWRSVLWLTEVEGVPPRDAAEILGLSANGVAQLAVRARSGLRERYLQAHVGEVSRDECRFTTAHLGAYVGGALAARDLAKVDQHLAACDDCRERRDELEEVGGMLRRIAIPAPLFLGAAVLGALRVDAAPAAATGPASTAGAAPAGAPARGVRDAERWNTTMRALAGASAGLLALGVIGVGIRAGDRPTTVPPPLASTARVEKPAEVKGFTLTRPPEAASFVVPDSTSAALGLASLPDLGPGVVATTAGAPAPSPAPATTGPAIGDPTTFEPSPAPASTSSSDPVLQVGATAGGTSGVGAAIGVGDGSCTGLLAGGTGTDPCVATATPSTDSLAVTVDPQGSGPVTIGLP